LVVIAAVAAAIGCNSREDKANNSSVAQQPQQPQQVAETQQGLQPSTNEIPSVASIPASGEARSTDEAG
jgi:hypothetical protein